MRRIACSMIVLLFACGRPIPEPLETLGLGAPAGPVRLVRQAQDAAHGGYDLFHPSSPVAVGNAVWLVDMGNDQLVRFDSTLSHARAFSHEGEGPGELQFPFDLVVSGDRVLVGESGNGRVSTFDTSGAFRSTLPTPETPTFVAGAARGLLVAVSRSSHYAYRLDDRRGGGGLYAAIPDVVRRMAASDSARYLPAGPYIAASHGGELYVLDQSVLALSRFDADGRLASVRLLPEPFRSQLLERRIRFQRGLGARAPTLIDSPAAKRISLSSDGRLIILFPLPDAWGLLVDTRSWTARPLLFPEDRRLRDILFGASDAALDGDRLYVISADQLYQFSVEGWR